MFDVRSDGFGAGLAGFAIGEDAGDLASDVGKLRDLTDHLAPREEIARRDVGDAAVIENEVRVGTAADLELNRGSFQTRRFRGGSWR